MQNKIIIITIIITIIIIYNKNQFIPIFKMFLIVFVDLNQQ